MCGIAGIISNKRDLDKSLAQMIHSMHHRGPDNGAFKKYNNIGLAHTRLSIIDLSNSANQPMEDASSLSSIVFNGEIYNYQELKNDLLKQGFKFLNNSDTEVLLNGYINEGLSFFEKVRGFYALGLLDKRNQTLLLVRDAYGKKPLYFSSVNQELIFASEIKTITQQLGTMPTTNYDGLAHYLWKGYYANGESAYSNIYSLLPGESIAIDINTLKIKERTIVNKVHINVANSYLPRDIEEVRKGLISAIDYRMISDVPVSFLLSGGVDSSLISYLASQNNDIDTYYLGYGDEDDIFEKLSTLVAEKIKSNHHINIMQAPRLKDSISQMINIFDEPFADYSALPSFEIYKSISEKTKVAISGDGADEIFGGYKDARLFLLRSLINLKHNKGSATDRILKLLNSSNKYMRYFSYMLSILILDEGSFSITTSRGGWNHAFRKEMMTKEGYEKTLGNQTEKREINDYLNLGLNPLERYLNYDLKRLTYDFLVKVDRTSMSNSLEVRSPFLDTQMLKDIGKTNFTSLVGLTDTKKELKKLLDGYGLSELTKVPKMGFTPPLLKWMLTLEGQKELSKTVQSSFINSLFRRKHLLKMVENNTNISKNYFRLWNILLLDAWHKKNYS